MDILIVGSGGREYAIGWKLKQSPKAGRLFFAPGNAGTSLLGENIPFDTAKPEELAMWAKEHGVGLVIIGRSHYFQMGLTDLFREQDIPVFGPSKAAAQIECSKVFAKKLLKQHGIPTAAFEIFTEQLAAQKYLATHGFPVVIKTDGPAFGEGVYIVHNAQEANKALEDIFSKHRFGNDGNSVIIEEFLEGQELSIHAFCDGENAVMLPSAQDHKRIYEGDKGPNTAGIGTIAPVPGITPNFLEAVKQLVILPTLQALKDNGTPFVGVMYPNIMITKTGIRVLEINARFGDPEVQSLLLLLESDLLPILEACVKGRIASTKIAWKPGFACCIVLCSGGYPGEYKIDLPITGYKDINDEVELFYGEVKTSGNDLVTNGPRVLGIAAQAPTLEGALANAYTAAKQVHFEGIYYRKDIGAKALAIQ